MSNASPDSETASFEQLQDTYDDFYVPQFTVTVGDTDYSEADGIVSDVSVDLALDKASAFSFTLNYPYDAEHGRFEGLDWTFFTPDRSVSITMGYGGEEAPLLHAGRISAVRPSFPASGSPTVSVNGYGPLHALSEPPEPGPGKDSWTHTWTDTSPPEVVEKLVSERGYEFEKLETADSGLKPPEIKQDESMNDLEFLLDLGETYAYELFSWKGALYFRPPRYDGPPDLVLTYGSSLESFSPEVNEAGQVDTIEVRNWSAEKGEEIVGEASREDVTGTSGSGSGEPTTDTLRLPVRDAEQATARAKAILANRLDGTVSGKGECIGLPQIRPGTRLSLERLTDRFSKVYYVESATHRFGSSGYRTSFSVKRRGL